MNKPKEIYLSKVNFNPIPNEGILVFNFQAEEDYTDLKSFLAKFNTVDNAKITLKETSKYNGWVLIMVNGQKFEEFEIPLNTIAIRELTNYEIHNEKIRIRLKTLQDSIEIDTYEQGFDFEMEFDFIDPTVFADEGKND
jgi:hypothetical protein